MLWIEEFSYAARSGAYAQGCARRMRINNPPVKPSRRG
jgi:hypothetical protein